MELLRKKDKWLRGEGEALTKEEFESVSQLESEGLTDYQKHQREWDAEKKHFQKDIDKNKEEIKQEKYKGFDFFERAEIRAFLILLT